MIKQVNYIALAIVPPWAALLSLLGLKELLQDQNYDDFLHVMKTGAEKAYKQQVTGKQ